MKIALSIVAAAAFLFVLDRLLLAAESRGWIYWRRKQASPGTFGRALLEFQDLFEPGKKAIVAEQQRERHEDDDSGDPPTP